MFVKSTNIWHNYIYNLKSGIAKIGETLYMVSRMRHIGRSYFIGNHGWIKVTKGTSFAKGVKCKLQGLACTLHVFCLQNITLLPLTCSRMRAHVWSWADLHTHGTVCGYFVCFCPSLCRHGTTLHSRWLNAQTRALKRFGSYMWKTV